MPPRHTWLHPWGSLGIAILAAGALAINSQIASQGLHQANIALVHGEGHALINAILLETRATEQPVSATPMRQILDKFQAQGLRHIAININGQTMAQAGNAQIGGPELAVGQAQIAGQRARLTGVLPPILPSLKQLAQSPLPPATATAQIDQANQVNQARQIAQLPHLPAAPMAGQPANFQGRIVIEFETPLIAKLTQSMQRTHLAALAAAIVLLVLALFLTRNAIRLRKLEWRAERERQLALLGEMSAVVAHELRNPLAALKGHSQLLVELLTQTLPPGSREQSKAERIVSEALRLEQFTHVLLDFVRDAPLDLRSMSAPELLAQLRIAVPDTALETDFTDAPAHFCSDPTRLVMALSNLIRNAHQAAPAASVGLRLYASTKTLMIEVSDCGPGIAPDQHERIFEPLVTTRATGTGLGLAAARRAITQLGGVLQAENRAGGGALFRICLPLDAPQRIHHPNSD